MKKLRENEWFLVETGGEPRPEAGLYKSRSGANRKRREFEARGGTAAVGLWERAGPLSWKKVP